MIEYSRNGIGIRRCNRGSMLALTAVCSGFLLLMAGFALCVAGVLVIQYNMQATADRVSLSAAQQLNNADTIGKINNLELRCRELVHSSREASSKAQATAPHAAALARELLEEARNAASELNTEQTNLKTLATQRANETISREWDETSKERFSLPWITVTKPRIKNVLTGRVKNTDSNVSILRGNTQILQADQSIGQVKAASHLYVPGTFYLLTAEDSDLRFQVSALPPPQGENALQARMMLPQSWEANQSELFDTAVSLELSSELTSWLQPSSSVLTVRSAATTSGARTFE